MKAPLLPGLAPSMIPRLIPCLAALLLASAGPAFAVQTPRSGAADPRMKTVDYDPVQVVRVVGAFRTATQILFGPGETIIHVALGDSSAWDVAAEKNILFLKPKVRRGLTNLIVTTSKGEDARNYTFELATREGADAGRGSATYFQLRFRYPQDEKTAVDEVITAEEVALRQKIVEYKLDRGVLEGRRNLAYSEQGSSALAPSEISDNGRFTVMRFPAAQPIPAIYSLTPDGSETLVPFDVRGEFVVVHAVVKELRLRRGRDVACVWNDAYEPYGVNLGTHTATADVDRADKGGVSP